MKSLNRVKLIFLTTKIVKMKIEKDENYFKIKLTQKIVAPF